MTTITTTSVSESKEFSVPFPRTHGLKSRLTSMSDRELKEHARTRLQASLDVCSEPFHPYHDQVDLVREECERRGKLRIFDEALNEI